MTNQRTNQRTDKAFLGVGCKSTKGSRGCNGMGRGGSGPSSLAEAGRFRFHRLFLFKNFQSFLKATYFKIELKCVLSTDFEI